ncbi:NAD(P)-binding protein [Stipitochalara longipes BDJ]|nr:NAD(P)-binding protein [Stipitochalara longipes BDJ]
MAFQSFMPFNFVPDPPDLPPPMSNPRVVWENKATLTRRRDTYAFIDPYRFKNKLREKVVIVTLAHRGIGKATAIAFAQAGASVCCIGPTAQSLEPVLRDIKEKYNTPTLALTANIVDPDAPAHIVTLVEKHLGPVDFLINITAASYFRSFVREQSIMQDFWPSIEQNLRAPIALTHAVLPSMIARNTGTIISTTSVPGILQFPFASCQGVAHTGLLKFHHHLDLETRAKGIFSYAVNPGPIPSHIHDPDGKFSEDPYGFSAEPGWQMELASKASEMEWASAGLASGTFVALCAEPRARCLSGLYVNAERDLGEVIGEVEHDRLRVETERMYVLKVDEF